MTVLDNIDEAILEGDFSSTLTLFKKGKKPDYTQFYGSMLYEILKLQDITFTHDILASKNEFSENALLPSLLNAITDGNDKIATIIFSIMDKNPPDSWYEYAAINTKHTPPKTEIGRLLLKRVNGHTMIALQAEEAKHKP